MDKMMALVARRSHSRLRIGAVLVLTLLLTLAGWIGNDLYHSYDASIESARREAENLSAIIESNILAAFAKIDVVLEETAYSFSPVLSGRSTTDKVSANRELLRLSSYIPETQPKSLRVVNADGWVVFSSGETADVPAVNVGDRKYFMRQKNGAAAFIVSEPLFSRFTQFWLLTLSRTVSAPDGRFLGIVQTALRYDFFQGLFDLVTICPGDSIALLDDNMRMFARKPHTPEGIGNPASLPASLAEQIKSATAGFIHGGSNTDSDDNLLFFRKVGDYPYVIVISNSRDRVLAVWRHKARLYALGYLGLVSAVLAFFVLAVRHQKELVRLAATDSLTGLNNRRTFDAHLTSAVRNVPHSVILIDIDQFKQVNDSFGHLNGDKVLQRVAAVLQRNMRSADIPCRWGGEEFIALLKNCQLAEAVAVAERLRRDVERENMTDITEGMHITISAGVAEATGANDKDAVMMADQALYRAKNLGRNRVCTYE